MGLFKKKKPEIRADTEVSFEDSLLTALLSGTGVTKTTALQIPSVESCIDLLSNIVSSTPIKLYKLNEDKVEEIKKDARLTLLNDDTGDTLNAHDFWKAIITDYFLGKGGYAYINKERNSISSLNYVDETYVSINKKTDPIFKDYVININGTSYQPYDFIKILRNSKDGASGTGIISEISTMIDLAYQSLVFENNLVKKGGNKKGFLKSEKKLDEAAMNALKTAFANLYSNNSENVIILNNGIDFKESSNTAVEMQLNENKNTNSAEICKIFHISPDVIAGKATSGDMQSVAKLAAMPLMKTIECALNRDLLLEKEKQSYYFAFDTKELLKGDLKERLDAYSVAVDKGIMTRNEARYMEDLPALEGMDVVSMSLADVIYDPATKTYFTPNTKQITSGEASQTALANDADTVTPTDTQELIGAAQST